MGDIGVIFENLYCTGLKVDLDGLQHVENVSALALSYGSVFYYQANNEDGGLIKKVGDLFTILNPLPFPS